MKKKIKKQIFKAIKKHNETLIILGLLLSIIQIVMPFFAERVIYIQPVREVWLPTLYDYHTNVGAQIKVSASVTLIIERTDGTVEYLEGKSTSL